MMFYDERIELERGMIARNGLAIAAVFALLGALLRGMNIYLNMGENRIHPKGQYYLSIATECIIAAVCLAALIVGVLYGGGVVGGIGGGAMPRSYIRDIPQALGC